MFDWLFKSFRDKERVRERKGDRESLTIKFAKHGLDI